MPFEAMVPTRPIGPDSPFLDNYLGSLGVERWTRG